MATLKDLLNKESKQQLNNFKSRLNNPRAVESIVQKLSHEERSALDLKSRMEEGIYKIPDSKLPIDFHKFHANFRDSAQGQWRQVMCEKYNIEHKWAFNAVTSDYPSLSVSEDIILLNRKLFNSLYTPGQRWWKYVIAFAETKEDFSRYVQISTRRKIKRHFENFVASLEGRIPRYVHLDRVDQQSIALSFFTRTFLITTPCVPAQYRGRYYFPMAPSEMINDKNHTFTIRKMFLLTGESAQGIR